MGVPQRIRAKVKKINIGTVPESLGRLESMTSIYYIHTIYMHILNIIHYIYIYIYIYIYTHRVEYNYCVIYTSSKVILTVIWHRLL